MAFWTERWRAITAPHAPPQQVRIPVEGRRRWSVCCEQCAQHWHQVFLFPEDAQLFLYYHLVRHAHRTTTAEGCHDD